MKIEPKHIAEPFNGLPVSWDINLTFRDGGCYCFMSPSGSGKATLLRTLMGLEQSDEGTLEVDIEPAAVSAVPQEDRLCKSFSPMENVTMCAGRSMKALRVRWEMVKLFSEECLSRPVPTLSGGMERRVAAPRALFIPSHVLLMDEPFTRTDEDLKRSAIAYIREKQNGRILILPTHQGGDVEPIGGELVWLAQEQCKQRIPALFSCSMDFFQQIYCRQGLNRTLNSGLNA